MKDALVKLPKELTSPAYLTGSDFSSPGGPAAGMAEGQNQLVPEGVNQCGPRHTEDEGPGKSGAGTPVPSKRSAVVGRNFKISRNAGEGSDSASSMSSKFQSVSLKDGQSVPNVMSDRS